MELQMPSLPLDAANYSEGGTTEKAAMAFLSPRGPYLAARQNAAPHYRRRQNQDVTKEDRPERGGGLWLRQPVLEATMVVSNSTCDVTSGNRYAQVGMPFRWIRTQPVRIDYTGQASTRQYRTEISRYTIGTRSVALVQKLYIETRIQVKMMFQLGSGQQMVEPGISMWRWRGMGTHGGGVEGRLVGAERREVCGHAVGVGRAVHGERGYAGADARRRQPLVAEQVVLARAHALARQRMGRPVSQQRGEGAGAGLPPALAGGPPVTAVVLPGAAAGGGVGDDTASCRQHTRRPHESLHYPHHTHAIGPTNFGSGEIWAALNTEVLRADEGEARWVWSSAGMQGRGNWRTSRKPADQRHCPAKIRKQPPSGIEPGSPRWDACSLTTAPPRPHRIQTKIVKNYELGEKDTNDINNTKSARQDKSNTERMAPLPQSIPELYEEEVDNSTQHERTRDHACTDNPQHVMQVNLPQEWDEPPWEPRVQGQEARELCRRHLTRTSTASSLLRARRAVFTSTSLQAVLQQDNARPHVATCASLKDNDVPLWPWSARSPATRLPPRRIGFDSRRGRSRILACGNRARRCPCRRVFSVIPTLLHTSPCITLIGSQDLDVVKSRANLFTSLRTRPAKLKRGEYGAEPKFQGGGKWKIPRKPTDQRHRPIRFPHAKIWELPGRDSNLVRLDDTQRYDGNTTHLARRSDEALVVRVSVARIAPSLLDLGRPATLVPFTKIYK
ncbi:hypothetical protein PR048_003208 [Dryococelus australis]|uniref:Uncharacterized protein n=1 Tax=Dryococelus australis TaxID=614101 RepID=A0ABQ9IMD0_9NEOP|nr:hypothetical protein PR048_003208 [Dryococelus australis]